MEFVEREQLDTAISERDAARKGIQQAHEILDDAGVARAVCDDRESRIGTIQHTQYFTVKERIRLLIDSLRPRRRNIGE